MGKRTAVCEVVDSNDLDAGMRVAVTASVTAPQRVDADVEKIVGRLSLEPTVSAARWQAEVQLDAESREPLGTQNVASNSD